MRLSEWRTRAPYREAMSSKVLTVIEATLRIFGADPDPACWIVWGDDPQARYLAFVPTPGGLLQVNVRVNVPGEGPRAGGKLIRWSRAQLGELASEMHGGHRLATFQVEGQVITGADDAAEGVGAFALSLFAAIDGRLEPAGAVAPSGSPVARRASKPVPRLPAPKGDGR